MTVEERIKLAAEKTKRILDSMRTLLQLRSINEIVLYSDTLSKQVPESFAANAFNVVTAALYEAELVRVCALWDPARNEKEARDRDSIPAVAWLIDENSVLEALANAIKERREQMPIRSLDVGNSSEVESVIEAALQRRLQHEAESERQKALERGAAVLKWIVVVEQSDLHKSLRNFRDKHVAHSLVKTNLERKGRVVPTRYGDEVKLFETSIEVVNELNYVVCNEGFAWTIAREQTQRHSRALWSGCRLNIKE